MRSFFDIKQGSFNNKIRVMVYTWKTPSFVAIYIYKGERNLTHFWMTILI